MPRQVVESAVLGSTEYFVKHGGSASAWVSAIYADVLHRAPGAAEKQGWVNALGNGLPYATAAQAIDTSFEANSVRAQTLFTSVLHRSPALAERTAWAQVYQGGMDVNAVLAYFVAGSEY